MDARVYFHLIDSIRDAANGIELEVARDLVAATTMHPAERRALERAVELQEAALRRREREVPRPIPPRAD